MPDDDIQLNSYQDDLNTDDSVTDPVMREEGEDISKELGVPAEELGDELDKEDGEDASSLIEDFDDDLGDDNY